MSEIGTALVQGGASLLNGIFGAIGAKKRQKRAIQHNIDMFNRQVAQQDKVNAQMMAYQDKVNEENRQWNTEKNVRKRQEEAGYNPYLAMGNGAMAGSVSNSTNLGNNVSAGSPVQLDDEYSAFAEGALNAASQVMSAYLTKKQAQSVDTDTAAAQYNLQKQQAIDRTITDDGNAIGRGVALEQANVSVRKHEADIALSNANIRSIESSLAEAKRLWYDSAAYITDEQGNTQAVTDEQGRQMTFGEYAEKGQLREQGLAFDRALQDLRNAKTSGDILKVQKKIDENKYKMQPLEAAILSKTAQEIQSKINVNEADAKLIKQQELTEKKETKLVNNQAGASYYDAQMRKKDYENYDTDKWIDRGGRVVDAATKVSGEVRNHRKPKINSTKRASRMAR